MKKKILVAPLNWGLGHATRCVPIINALIAHNFEPIIASDGSALELLKQDFPKLTCLELPSYNIKYSKNAFFIKLKLLIDAPKVIMAIKAENDATKKIVQTHHIDGIISDNRYGVHHVDLPCVFVTHQLQVLSGNTSWLSTRIQQKLLTKFTECWVPDTIDLPNLSGKLGHSRLQTIPTKHIGPLSRFKKIAWDMRYDIMVMLSGPEPQRSILEKKLMLEFQNYNGKVLFIKGIIEKEKTIEQLGKMTIYNYLMGVELEKAMIESDLIIARSGYTTIMDLAKLGKKAFFIPTPGQYEQEYLAEHLQDLNLVPYCNQHEFKLDKLKEVSNYKGFEPFKHEVDYERLFQLF